MSNVHHTRTAPACLRPLAAGLVLAAGFTLAPQAALAATATDTIAVTATVQATCTVVASPLAFGTYNPISTANVDASTTLNVTCTQGTAYNVGLSAGGGTGATTTVRKLTSSGHTLNYALYQDTTRATNWGNTIGTDTVTGTAGTTATAYTVYGRIPGSQNTTAGAYTDSVTVTVTY
ncbi:MULTISPECIES: spore coat U domain-containing protein [unclassified Novosphingobium]|uniref:Csu type fimbrial protein n=1 Tax=unclassified Novosphingobium TaxID=2644732 RepID=UPI001357948F|nr:MULTISPECIES: spore coat U domain-containing protein [unclassified Novosphingobium]